MGETALSRRHWLQLSGALVVSFCLPEPDASGAPAPAEARPPLLPTELDSFVAVDASGHVTAFFGKVDVGHGIEVAIGQIVAEELDVAFDDVTVVMGDTARTVNQGGASGSHGIKLGGKAMRNAAAEARRLLVERAATRLALPAQQLTVADGIVSFAGDPQRRISYAKLIGGQYFHAALDWNKVYGNELAVKGQATPKKASDYRIVGRSLPQKVIPAKVLGTAQYVTEVQVEGMLHGRMIRPPSAGTQVVAIDERSIAAIPGARVLREQDFIGVVAPHEWDAVRAAQALKVTWSAPTEPFPAQEQLFAHIRNAAPNGSDTPVQKGDVDAAMKAAQRIIEAEYEWPFQSHACIGPACAVADVKRGSARLWTSTQKPHYANAGAAALLGLPEKNVHTTWVMGPGSYGRNEAGDVAMDAVLMSKLAGRPVRVQWMRHEGTAWDPKSPAMVSRLRAGLDAAGDVIAYEFHGKGFSRREIAQSETEPKDTLAGQLTGRTGAPTLLLNWPSDTYGFAHKRYAWETIPALLTRGSPLRTSHLRDPLGPETHFASESFIDELAHDAGADPVAFRLKHIANPRHAAVLRAAAERAGWSARPYPNPDRGKGAVMTGRGVAYTERLDTIVAVICEVEVDRRSGRIWAKRFTVAQDCGQIINPGSLRLVLEGNMVHAASRTLYEETRFDRNSVQSVDWASYPILDMADAPEAIDVVLLDRPGEPPSGAGEPSSRAVPAAIANAVFDATGLRLRRAPLTAARMKAALERAERA